MSETAEGWTPSLGRVKREREDDLEGQSKAEDGKGVKLEKEVECSICLTSPPNNAVLLDCKHSFCFLCIKSVAATTGKCPLCRADIDIDLEYGNLEVVGALKLPISEDGYFWFYQGRTGWWLYDADTNKELESAYRDGKKQIERLIAGNVYVISLTKLKQYQKSERSRFRRVCRDTLNLGKILGVAGLRGKTPRIDES